MKQAWQNLQIKYEKLLTREKLLLLVAAMAVLYMCFEFFWFQPLMSKQKLARDQERVAMQNLSVVESEMTVLNSLVGKEPFAQLRLEVETLERERNALEQHIKELSSSMIAVNDMPGALQQLIAEAGKLQLQSFNSKPMVALQPDAPKHGLNATLESQPLPVAPINEDRPKLYKHGFQFRVQGSYQDVIELMQMMERAPWRFYGEQLSYRQTSADEALVLVTVYALSTQPGIFRKP